MWSWPSLSIDRNKSKSVANDPINLYLNCLLLCVCLYWSRYEVKLSYIVRGTTSFLIVIEEVLWSIRGSYQTIWSFPLTNVKWHSVTWPYTMTTPYWSDFVPNSTFYRILSGFHMTFATGVACRQGTLTPPDTWSRPFGTCICSTCRDQSFSELVVILPDYALRISLGTFSILLLTVAWKAYFVRWTWRFKLQYTCIL